MKYQPSVYFNSKKELFVTGGVDLETLEIVSDSFYFQNENVIIIQIGNNDAKNAGQKGRA